MLITVYNITYDDKLISNEEVKSSIFGEDRLNIKEENGSEFNALIEDIVVYIGRAMHRNRIVKMHINTEYDNKPMNIELETMMLGSSLFNDPWEEAKMPRIKNDF